MAIGKFQHNMNGLKIGIIFKQNNKLSSVGMVPELIRVQSLDVTL